MNNTQDFSTAKVGDKLWSIQLGECYVKSIIKYQICSESQDKTIWYYYDLNGTFNVDDKFPSLFWSNPNIQIPERPKRKVIKTVEKWCNIYEGFEGFPCISDSISMANKNAENNTAMKRIAIFKLTGTYEIEE